jgi:hypothetical protein
VPFEGIKWVRIHFLLDLLHYVDATDVPGGSSNTNFTIFNAVRIASREHRAYTRVRTPPNAHVPRLNPQGFLSGKAINWTDLDASLDMVINSGLYPGFEVMGNPQSSSEQGLFSSFKEDAQLAGFGDLMKALALRYIALYGADNVRQWRFESWNGALYAQGASLFFLRMRSRNSAKTTNVLTGRGLSPFTIMFPASSEPDGECSKGLDVGIDCDIPSFINYMDVTEHALHSVDPEVRPCEGTVLWRRVDAPLLSVPRWSA